MNQNSVNLHKKDILVVDDLPDNLRILSSILTEQGYKVRKALNGQMALTACKTILPDLILLDIKMPNMDGYQVCQQLKADERTREVPVIFVSAMDEIFDKIKAFNIGGADYITKPFQIEEILVRIKNQLTISQLFYNLTEQNAKLKQLNEELSRSNTELEQFAYVASHDLQSPLQSIIMSAELLNLKYKNSLATDGERYIVKIVDATMRMKQLIQDLLNYSRTGSDPVELEPIDCKTVLEEALANLDGAISSSRACITYSNLPTVIADGRQLIQLFQNLLGNAIKFCRPEVPPQIKITAEVQSDGKWIIGVHDNGIGIEPQHFERLFEMFKRLHTSQKYPGTGIGMSICKKIVERHGGRIWLESQVGVGTSFYFTIPS